MEQPAARADLQPPLCNAQIPITRAGAESSEFAEHTTARTSLGPTRATLETVRSSSKAPQSAPIPGHKHRRHHGRARFSEAGPACE
jgi:hypothetical protein